MLRDKIQDSGYMASSKTPQFEQRGVAKVLRMLVSLTVGKVDAGVTVLLTPDKRLIEFPSILLPPNISSGSIVDINVSQNSSKETAEEQKFRALQDRIFNCFGASEPSAPVLRCRNATQTSVVLEWDPIELATADLISLSLYRNGNKAGPIPRPLQMHSTKISGLAVDTEYTFHLVLRTSAGTRLSDKVTVRTHKMTDLSGITITTGILPGAIKENLTQAVERIGAKIVDGVRIDTTHFVTTEGRGTAWEKAVENNIPVVRPEWVDACEKNGRILGVTKFYLDAMRPGPPSEEQVAPPVPPKEEAAREPPAGQGSKTEESDKGADDAAAKEDKASEEQSSDDDAAEPEQKAKSPLPDEQKMRLEDMEEQKVALRPRGAEPSEDGGADGEQKDGEDEDEEGETNGKPAATPDGASFQEVEL
ncbi:Cell fusion protein cfr1 [Purpureocillium lavendulum]|uniref:Cell fusion protein cfr1 n=1 Tax=Purpureocillium lavendulum TaxID=1247861 RepID=A0AB34FXI5_9HYPO|nr:Cell fusion protein cfr1 [Purpureocillium lavendulum]